MCVETLGYTGMKFHSVQASSACGAPDSGVTQVTTGPTAGSNATVLQDGVEVGGRASAGLSGRERLHGGEDQGQTVCYVLVWGTGQSWCVACRGSTGTEFTYNNIFVRQEI